MPDPLTDLVDPTIPQVPAHCTVREALMLARGSGHLHVAVRDGDVFSGIVSRSALHANDRPGSRPRSASTHVCELIEDDSLVVGPDADPCLLRAALRERGLLEVVVVDDGRLLGVVSLVRLDGATSDA
ncbi:hypothetical protein [Solicola sp. PLA-1-18]|uniref:hypothetical protein n=1 Tax=Solicola sp. PLA-1-18 TaxID=3380532 RepID=UPI003B7E93BC